MIQTYQVTYEFKYNNLHYNRHSRQAQYDLCRALGFSYGNAQRMRDWTLSHVAQCSNARIIQNVIKPLNKGVL